MLLELTYFQSEHFSGHEVTLLGCIFDVYSIHKAYSEKPLSLLMTFGKVLVQRKPGSSGDVQMTNMTVPKKPKSSGKQHYHLMFGENKECIWIHRNVPYSMRRIYHSNILDKIARDLVSSIICIYLIKWD